MLPRGFVLVGIALGLIALVFCAVLALQAIHGALTRVIPNLPENDRQVAIFFEDGGADTAAFAGELWRVGAEPLISAPLEEVDRIGADRLPNRSRFYPSRLAVGAGRLYVIEDQYPHIHRFTLPGMVYDGPAAARGVLPAGDMPESLSIDENGTLLAVGWKQVTAIGTESHTLATDRLRPYAAGCAVGDHIYLFSPYWSNQGPDLSFDRMTQTLVPIDSVGERRHLKRVSANLTAIVDLVVHAGMIDLYSYGEAAAVRYDPATDRTEQIALPGAGMQRLAEEFAEWMVNRQQGEWNALSAIEQAASAGDHLYILSVRGHAGRGAGVARDLVIAEVDAGYQPRRLWHVTLRPQRQTVFLKFDIRDFAVALIDGEPLFFLTTYRYFQDLEVDTQREYRSLHVLRPVAQSSASVNSQPQ